ncbi:unnamed protein product [Phytophthora fragariaefolia]|uniref:Unnamed protein product n=1 Tax=Phytophthora fragariaefolia TaxID=1490495 RepID=A0A9W6TL30_9STRA|nr:unnamed protein product [Phytophthora fragariaefolia]
MSPNDREEHEVQPAATQLPPTEAPARERGRGVQEESESQDAAAALLAAVGLLTTRIDAIERAATPRPGAISPDEYPRRGSIFRQAIENGSLGMQRMQLDELVRTTHEGIAPAPPQQVGGQALSVHGGDVPYGYSSYGQSKLSVRDFDGRETYKGLGAGFEQWALMLIGQIDMAERACGFRWPEEVKLNKLAQHLTGKAGRFFREQANTWWTISPFLFYALEPMNATFTVRLSMEDAAVTFTAAKDSSRSWNDHFLYLIALMRATDASPAMVLQNIVRHASPRFSPTLLGRYNEQRQDLMMHAQELVQFAQRFDTGAIDRKIAGKDVVSAVTDTRQCYNCKQP